MSTQTIHNDFRTALNTSTLKPRELPKHEDNVMTTLQNLGFTSSSTYMKSESLVSKITQTKEENRLIARILEIEARYPYRIISLTKILELGKKYGLAVGSVSDYIEMIPEENIQEMQEYVNKVSSTHVLGADMKQLMSGGSTYNGRSFHIAAPPSFFKKGLVNVEGFMINLPNIKGAKQNFLKAFAMPPKTTDPIVLQALAIKGNDIYFHIVTAWDIEAEDENVTTTIPANLSKQ